MAPTVPRVADCEPSHPEAVTPTANNSSTMGLEFNTHGNVHESPFTRSINKARNTATGTATMATTSGVSSFKRKYLKNKKPKEVSDQKDGINPYDASTAQPESSKNQTGLPQPNINKGKAKAATQTLSESIASEARPTSGRLADDSSTRPGLAGTKRKWKGAPPTDARIVGWGEFALDTGGDKRSDQR